MCGHHSDGRGRGGVHGLRGGGRDRMLLAAVGCWQAAARKREGGGRRQSAAPSQPKHGTPVGRGTTTSTGWLQASGARTPTEMAAKLLAATKSAVRSSTICSSLARCCAASSPAASCGMTAAYRQGRGGGAGALLGAAPLPVEAGSAAILGRATRSCSNGWWPRTPFKMRSQQATAARENGSARRGS